MQPRLLFKRSIILSGTETEQLSEDTATGAKHQVCWIQYRGHKLDCNISS